MAVAEPSRKKVPREIEILAKKIVSESAVAESKRWGTLFADVSDEKVGQRLRSLRKSRGVKAVDVAAEMGCENTTVCNLEKGRFKWDREKVLEYVSAIINLSESE